MFSIKRIIVLFLVTLFLFLTLCYAFVFLTNQNHIKKDYDINNQTNINTEINEESNKPSIADIDTVKPYFKNAVKNTYEYLGLDSENNFNPTDNVTKVTALEILHKVGKIFTDYGTYPLDNSLYNNINIPDKIKNKFGNFFAYAINKGTYNDVKDIINKEKEYITRLDFVILLSSYISEGQDTKCPYDDVPENYKPLVAKVMNVGIIAPNDKLYSNNLITREELLEMLYRLETYYID
ncbi:MAG: hypothetical protein ACOCP8_00015 [archaeon]